MSRFTIDIVQGCLPTAYSSEERMRERLVAEQRRREGAQRVRNAALFAVAIVCSIAAALIISGGLG